jgi:hypothetical protein
MSSYIMHLSYFREWESSPRAIPLIKKDGWVWDTEAIAAHDQTGCSWKQYHHIFVHLTRIHKVAYAFSWEGVYEAWTTDKKVCTCQVPSEERSSDATVATFRYWEKA